MSPGCRPEPPARSDATRSPGPCRSPFRGHHDASICHRSAMVLRDAALPASDKQGDTPELRPVPFDLGRLCVTSNAMTVLPPLEVIAALARHARGDWGTLPVEDREANDRALVTGDRLLSVYQTSDGVKFYVITEGDRSVTTVLLPEDY